MAISAQLLLWTISGIYFSFNNIEDVRGSQYLKPKEVIETAKGIKIEAQQAIDLVAEKTYLTPKSVIEITEEESGAEYRGRSLPLYKIETMSDNIGNIFLKIFSILALISSLSGIYLFFTSASRLKG